LSERKPPLLADATRDLARFGADPAILDMREYLDIFRGGEGGTTLYCIAPRCGTIPRDGLPLGTGIPFSIREKVVCNSYTPASTPFGRLT